MNVLANWLCRAMQLFLMNLGGPNLGSGILPGN
jgi:hypothetical protein